MRIRTVAVVGVVTLAVLAGCSSSDDSGSKGSSTSTTAATAETLTILVANDDGYSAEGIDTVVEALRKLPERRDHRQRAGREQERHRQQTTPGTVHRDRAEDEERLPGDTQ